MLTRRGLLRGVGAVLVTAPAIVRVSSLMALSPLRVYETPFVSFDDAAPYWRYQFHPNPALDAIRGRTPFETEAMRLLTAEHRRVYAEWAMNYGNVPGGGLLFG